MYARNLENFWIDFLLIFFIGASYEMKYLILGAGPSGLAFAIRLLENGEDDFLVLEAEDVAGGLCRSVDVDGSPLDIGGGHFLDVRRTKVNEFLFKFMPEGEWDYYDRNSCISINSQFINHPFEANIWQMDVDSQVEYLKSIAQAGCNTGIPMPSDFVDWIYWKLGEKIANDYMIPYNRKMFGDNLNQLGTYWLEKLPNVSFDDTIRSCLLNKPYGQQPGHAQFYYPKKYGYGELWLRMADNLGNKIEYNRHISGMDVASHTIYTNDGESYSADNIITTIPWAAFRTIKGMPESLRQSLSELKHSSIQVKYYGDNLDTKAQWIYYPNPELSFHRILVRHNFCPESRGYWTETNSDRISMETDNDRFKYLNEYAYPLNTVSKPMIMNKLLKWCSEHGIYGLGRWGEHQHYNSDLTVELSIKLADRFSL